MRTPILLQSARRAAGCSPIIAALVSAPAILVPVSGAEAATLQFECVEANYGLRFDITIDTDTGALAMFVAGRRGDFRAEVSSHTIQWQWQHVYASGPSTERYILDRYSGRLEVRIRNAAGGGKRTTAAKSPARPAG